MPAKTNTKAKTRSRALAESKTKRKSKKVNLLKLYAEMNKISNDAVDREVIKRFKVIIDTCEEDITKTSLTTVLRDPRGVDIATFDEIFQPYIKHYIFLLKRTGKQK